jgi:hypothetical protein
MYAFAPSWHKLKVLSLQKSGSCFRNHPRTATATSSLLQPLKQQCEWPSSPNVKTATTTVTWDAVSCCRIRPLGGGGGCLTKNSEVADCTMKRKWKLLFVIGCESLNPYQDCTNASSCSVFVQNNTTLQQTRWISRYNDFWFYSCDSGHRTYWASSRGSNWPTISLFS